ncbi:MAG: YIP1 family protein [archaeon]
MNLNILHPSKAVDSAFEKPSIPIALVLVLLPSLAFLCGLIVYGQDISSFAVYEIILAYVTFFVLVLIVFALGLLFDGKKAKGKFAGTICALSLLQIVSLAFSVLSLIAIPLVLSPEAIQFAGHASGTDQISEFLTLNPSAINFAALAVFLAISACLIVWGIYILYKGIRKLTETRAFTSLILAIITLIILGLLPI